MALRNVINYCKNEGKLIVVVSHRRSVLDYSDKILEFPEDKDIRIKDREFLRKVFLQNKILIISLTFK